MNFRILGPLEVYAGDMAVPVGGAKPRALLAILLLHANEVVSTDRLIDALWGERPPETAAKALQVHVSQLRKALDGAPDRESSRIETRAPGYVLEFETDDLDLHRFRRLHQEARDLLASDPARARNLLAQALDLWRGSPLADFAYEAFAQAEIARLEELRIAAVEDRVEADLALGRHSEAIGELEAAIGAYPLRERLRGQLMLALYRSGRQAEALQAYQGARAALTNELGIELGRELRDLQQAILTQDAKLDRPPPADTSGDGQSGGVFVGRERELGELVGGLEDVLAGHGRVVLVAGEPGIGKSRLADELMGRARAREVEVLVGRSWEAGGAPAYWPWIQSLRAHARELEPQALQVQLGAGAADLAQLLPDLRELFPDLPAPSPLESEGARFRLFESVAAFIRSAARVRPIVLVLDDLHAADEPSLLLLRFVAREIATDRVLVLGLFRDIDPTIGAALGSTLAELAREPHVAQVVLGGLDEPSLADYIELSTGIEPAARLVEAIHGETEGNPLFAAETVRLLHAEGRIAEADAHLRIPPGVRAVIGQRVARLSDRCQAVLVRASVLGREFGLDALARFARLSHDELLDVLDEAMAERVVGDVPGSPGRLRFGHALIRDTLYDELTPARRLQLHRDAGEALEDVYSTVLDSHLAELARHFLAAAPAGMAGRAVEYARRAGDGASAQLAYEEAARLYEAALRLVDDPITRCEVLVALGEARARAGDTPASKEGFREAAALAERHGLTELLARAALGYGGRMMWDVSRGDDQHAPLLARALAALDEADSPLRVRLLARLAGGPLRDASFPPERKAALSQEALEAARRIGDPMTLAYAIQGYILGHHSPEHTERQLELGAELVQLATQAGDKERVVEGHEELLDAYVELGDAEAGRRELEAMAKVAGELRQPSHDWFVACYRSLFALLEGRLADAETLVEDSRRVGERAVGWNAVVTYGLQLYVLRREQGRLEEIADLIRRSAEENPTYPIWRCVQGQAAVALGHEAEARAILGSLVTGGSVDLPFDEEWLVSVGLLSEAAISLGAAEQAAVLYPRLLPYAGRVAISYPEISTGSVARNLGLLAATMERWDEAADHFEEAVATNERIGARSWAAHAGRDHARMLLAHGATTDRERASRLLSLAIGTYRELGMESYAVSASRELAGAA